MILILLITYTISSYIITNDINKTDLIGCWTDSMKEKNPKDSIRIFRPCDFKEFPASRFRFIMELKNDEKCICLYLAPIDAHQMMDGTWNHKRETKTLRIFNTQNGEVKVFQVSEKEEKSIKNKKRKLLISY